MQMNLQRGLVGHWTMDSVDTIGDTIHDRSGRSIDGEHYGGVEPNYPSPVGDSYSFNGTDTFILLAGQNTFPGITTSGTYTFSAWVLIHSWNRAPVLEISNSGSDRNQLGLSGGVGEVAITYYDGSYSSIGHGSAALNEWIHIAGVNENGTLRFYINGSEQTYSTSNVYGGGGGARIGRDSASNRGTFDGLISDVRVYNRVLSEAEINVLYNTRSSRTYGSPHVPQRPVAASDLVAWYPFEGKASDATAYQHWAADDSDYAGIVNGATYQANGGVTDIRRGNGSGAYDFDGQSYIQNSSLNIDTSLGLTVCTWVYFDSGSSYSGIVGSNTADSYDYWLLRENSGSIDFYVGDGSNYDSVSTPQLTGEWMFLTAVHTGSDIRLYTNGDLKSSTSTSYTSPSSGAIAGAYTVGSGVDYYIDGKLDDIRLYRRALTASEISRIYANTEP